MTKHREIVTLGTHQPRPARAVVVTEGPPTLVAIEPTPEAHSPTEVQHAAPAIAAYPDQGPPLVIDIDRWMGADPPADLGDPNPIASPAASADPRS